MTKYLTDFQFGVGTSGGAEIILHNVNIVLSQRHGDGLLSMLTVVFFSECFQLDRHVGNAVWGEIKMPHLFHYRLSFFMIRQRDYTLVMDILCLSLECNKATL